MSLCFWYPKTPLQPTAERQTCFLLPMVAKRKIKKVMGLRQREAYGNERKIIGQNR